MVNVIIDKCTGCKLCTRNCPIGAIDVVERKAVVSDACVQCGICIKVCNFGALERTAQRSETVKCSSCPVQCEIAEGFSGACTRYENHNGKLIRNRKLVVRNEKTEHLHADGKAPLATAVGSGTNYPCSRPAPHIICEEVDNVDMITVVTEAPLSYSGVKVKVDTNIHLGAEGEKIKRNGKVIGMIETEEYGSKMLAIGGANQLTGVSGFVAADSVVKLANGESIDVITEDSKVRMTLQAGKAPVINGVEDTKMRVGCGSATIGLFARDLAKSVDEAIILDHHVVGLFSEHLAGAEVGKEWSGVIPNARKSTRGRYFGEQGTGWGGTDITEPINAIKEVDMSVAKAGLQILVTETTGQNYAMFEVQADGSVKEMEMTDKALAVVEKIQRTCEPSRVSVIYSAGTGGSARAGVTNEPLEITKAVHDGRATLTVGGAPVFVYPGGGINFLVDTELVVPKAFTWVPSPATVAPIEYTMTKADYLAIGGHEEHIKNLKDIKDKEL